MIFLMRYLPAISSRHDIRRILEMEQIEKSDFVPVAPCAAHEHGAKPPLDSHQLRFQDGSGLLLFPMRSNGLL